MFSFGSSLLKKSKSILGSLKKASEQSVPISRSESANVIATKEQPIVINTLVLQHKTEQQQKQHIMDSIVANSQQSLAGQSSINGTTYRTPQNLAIRSEESITSCVSLALSRSQRQMTFAASGIKAQNHDKTAISEQASSAEILIESNEQSSSNLESNKNKSSSLTQQAIVEIVTSSVQPSTILPLESNDGELRLATDAISESSSKEQSLSNVLNKRNSFLE